MPLDLDTLKKAVKGSAAAFRCRRRLQPAGGEGDKVFPPTFAGAVYAIEDRRVPGRGEPVTCVLLDSVQSQANRMEQALHEAIDADELQLPLLVVDFSDQAPTGDVEADKQAERLIDAIGKVTSLQVPHRLADAILRDSEVEELRDGATRMVPFRSSEEGKTLNQVSAANATPLFKLCPTALVFGMWDSTGPKGGLGPKFERAMVSEIVGVEAEVGDLRRGVRRDPLEIRAAVKVRKAADTSWRVAEPTARARDIVAPSAVNHSSVPFPKQREKKSDENTYDGVTIAYAEQTTTLSLVCLRRLRFPTGGAAPTADADNAARTVLAALGLVAATLAFESGIGLRSRCLLWPDGPMEWELLERPGVMPTRFTLDRAAAIALLKNAIAEAKTCKLPWLEQPLDLKPSAELLKLVRLSQLEATKEAGEAP